MGHLFEFDAANNVLRCSWEGRVTDDMLFECYSAGGRLLASHPKCRGLDDFSGATRLDISSKAIGRMAEMQPVFGAELMHVIVAPEDLAFGLARMFSMLGERSRPNLHVVRTKEEAYGLLGITRPQFSRVSAA
jgi:hypothetical protein